MIIWDNPWWSRIINGAPGSKLLNTDPCSSIMDMLLKVLFKFLVSEEIWNWSPMDHHGLSAQGLKFLVSWGASKLEPHDFSWIIMDHHGLLWIIIQFQWLLWIVKDYHEIAWITMDYLLKVESSYCVEELWKWSPMDHHGLTWTSMDWISWIYIAILPTTYHLLAITYYHY